ncbi:hypothetical protein P186_1245 [Pyrobaculum ferrireducens]|uniref:Uncharacterized protein n=1 Tax=Pyrobaculum ferrireducens TaxID=1104324 RepID=G7VCY5_9CREN|nr:hypothetical protein P186_1245 [Pyrobaculum ferrireducens]
MSTVAGPCTGVVVVELQRGGSDEYIVTVALGGTGIVNTHIESGARNRSMVKFTY